MKDWLEDNPNGLKDAFEKYFKELPVDVRKVRKCSYSHILFTLTLLCEQTYKDRVSAAVRALYFAFIEQC
jgi:hypothetical protein